MFGISKDRRRRSTLAITLVIFLLVAVLASIPSPTLAQDAGAGGALTSLESDVLTRLNARRATAGLGPLVMEHLLSEAAQTHADDILNNYNYSHWGTDGTLVRDRVARTGYSDNPWVSENWVSAKSPEAAMRWWMNDYVHMVNILKPRWTEVGVGAAVRNETGEMIFVTVFSAGRNANASASAAPVVSASSGGGTVVRTVVVPPGGLDYEVQKGDTLLAIALRHDVSSDEITSANGLTDDTLLQIGQVLRIPGSGDEYDGAVVTGVGGPANVPMIPYEIQSGDTLVTIAGKMGMGWQELARMNGLSDSSILQIGQTIQVPEPEGTETAADGIAETSAETSEPIDESEGEDSVVAVLHVIEANETLFGIAMAYGVDLQELLTLNGLFENSIVQPGQMIRLK